MRGKARVDRGVAVVELVVVVGLLALLLFSILELGRVSHVRLVLSAAAREGARLASVDGGESARVLEGVDRQVAWGGINPQEVTVEVVPRWAAYGSTIRVTVSHRYRFLSGMMTSLFPDGVGLQETVYGRSERLEGR